jgi:hypothetical protein
VSEKAAWVREYEAGWARELAHLAALGYVAELTGLAAPVQLEGTLDTRERFYFRCRHKDCELWISRTGADPLDEPNWTGEQPWGSTPHSASYIPPTDAVQVLLRLVDRYRESV